ncbi:hypothetical protein GVN21_11710 [Caulobacter sp. SLTY]|uniref:ATP-binding protein n=1 Tax=Caulobacter sp. SLTY TaxID=2683262 RepID=UPI001412CE0F|nr:ATP-binding protein [Caulobacter sp. SLTY]NBB16023.1 hypothetical protein [Caulobacter sp. SLTY]
MRGVIQCAASEAGFEGTPQRILCNALLAWIDGQLKQAGKYELRAPVLADLRGTALNGLAEPEAGQEIDTQAAARAAAWSELDSAANLAIARPALPWLHTHFDGEQGWCAHFVVAWVRKLRQPELKTFVDHVRQVLLGQQVSSLTDYLTSVHALAEKLDLALFGAPPVPLWLPGPGAFEETYRLSFQNPAIPFVGRERQLAEIEAFLDDPAMFRWHMVVGGGGAGKSRFALELARRQEGEWRVGFAQQIRKFVQPAFWNPGRPHLVIVDYVLSEAKELGELLAWCVGLPQSGPKIRVLLLERADDPIVRSQVVQDQASRPSIEQHRWAQNALELPALTRDELWEISAPFRADSPIDRDAFFDVLARLDPDYRALTALLIAEAAGRGQTDFSDLEALLEEHLKHERKTWWGRERDDHAVKTAEDLLALSTMVDGYVPQRHAPFLPRGVQLRAADEAVHPRVATLQHFAPPGQRAGAVLGRLLPDLVGEYFVLDRLRAQSKPNLGTGVVEVWLPDTAWRGDARATAEFCGRAARDFPDLAVGLGLDRPVAGVADSYAHAASRAFATADGDADERLREAFTELETYAADSAAWAAGAALLLFATAQPAGVFKNATLEAELVALEERSGAEGAAPELAVAWAGSVMNFVTDVAAPEPDRAARWLKALEERSGAEGAAPELAVEWANSVTNFVARVAANHPDRAELWLEALVERSGAEGAAPELAVAWAKSVMNFVTEVAAPEPDRAEVWLKALEERSGAEGAAPQLAVEWANSVTNFVGRIAADHPDRAELWLKALEERSGAEGAAPELAVEWAKSVTNFVGGVAADHPARAELWLKALEERSGAEGAASELAVEWASSVMNFVTDVAAPEPDRAELWLKALEERSGAEGAAPELAVLWAGSVMNFVTDLAAPEPDRAELLLKALEERSGAEGAAPELAVEWAKSVTNFVGRVAADHPDRAELWLEALEERFRAEGAAPEPAVEWAKSVTNFVGGVAANHPDRAELWLKALEERSGAEGAAPELAVEWAKSVKNFVGRVSADHPDRAELWLAALEERSGAEGAAPELAVEWAKSVTNFVGRVSADHPDRAELWLKALEERSGAEGAVPELAVAWANSVMNFVTDVAAPEPDRAELWLAALEERSGAEGAASELAVAWANSVMNFVTDLAAPEPVRAELWLKALEERSGAEGAAPELAVLWAKSVTNFVSGGAANHPDRAELWLKALEERSGAEGAAPELAVEWAKSVMNFVTDVAAPEPDRAELWLKALEERSGAEGAAPQLAVEWAKSVMNVVTDVAASEPDLAELWLKALEERSGAESAAPELAVEWAKSVTNFVSGVAADHPDRAELWLKALEERARYTPSSVQIAEAWSMAVAALCNLGPKERAPSIYERHAQWWRRDPRPQVAVGWALGQRGVIHALEPMTPPAACWTDRVSVLIAFGDDERVSGVARQHAAFNQACLEAFTGMSEAFRATVEGSWDSEGLLDHLKAHATDPVLALFLPALRARLGLAPETPDWGRPDS